VHRGQLWGRAEGQPAEVSASGEAWTLFAQPKRERDLYSTVLHCAVLCFQAGACFVLVAPFCKG